LTAPPTRAIQLLNDPLDCEWLRSTHLQRFDPQAFKSFEICGAEDTPTCVKTYAQFDPSVFDLPLETYTRGRGGKLLRAAQ
jgi:hypothetical protein